MSDSLQPHGWSPPGSSVHGYPPGKNTGVVGNAHLQEIFPTQGLNLGLQHCRRILYQLSCQESLPSSYLHPVGYLMHCSLHKSQITSLHTWVGTEHAGGGLVAKSCLTLTTPSTFQVENFRYQRKKMIIHPQVSHQDNPRSEFRSLAHNQFLLPGYLPVKVLTSSDYSKKLCGLMST